MTAPSPTGTVMGTIATTCEITRSRGSWLADGFRVGYGARPVEPGQVVVLFPRPWYRRAWRWLRRKARRPDGQYTVVAVTPTVIR